MNISIKRVGGDVLSYTYSNGGSANEPTVSLNVPQGNVFAIRNLDGTAFSAIAYRTSANVEHGAMGMNADGSVVYTECSDLIGTNPPIYKLYFTYGGDSSLNHTVLQHNPSGDTFMWTKSCQSTAMLWIQDAGTVVITNQSGFGMQIYDPRPSGGYSSIRFMDHDGATEKLAIGAFTGTNTQYMSPAGNFFVFGSGYKLFSVPNSAPADDLVQTGGVAMWIDEGGNLKFKVKYSGGTVKNGAVPLS